MYAYLDRSFAHCDLLAGPPSIPRPGATQVIGGWSLVANVSHRYDSLPPAGIKKTDVLFFTGLQYGWGPK